MNTYPMEPGALEGALLTVAATTPDMAAGIRAHIDSLTAELAQKNATIKALTSALRKTGFIAPSGAWHAFDCMGSNATRDCSLLCGEYSSALRLAGVLK